MRNINYQTLVKSTTKLLNYSKLYRCKTLPYQNLKLSEEDKLVLRDKLDSDYQTFGSVNVY